MSAPTRRERISEWTFYLVGTAAAFMLIVFLLCISLIMLVGTYQVFTGEHFLCPATTTRSSSSVLTSQAYTALVQQKPPTTSITLNGAWAKDRQVGPTL